MDRHVDIDALIEDYAWNYFKDMLSLRKASGLDTFKSLDRADVEFVVNRKKLVIVHNDPDYGGMQLTGTRPNTIFKSVFTNNTTQTQAYSLKTERTSESICGVVREQGWMFGAEAELTLKTPCEIAELKTGFKHEVHFNNLTENTKSETLCWSVDSNIMVPSGVQTEAGIVIEEMNYHGSYTLASFMSGMVTISIRRNKDGALVLPVTANIVSILQEFINRNDPRLKGVVKIENNKVKLTSRGNCHFQFAIKQYVELTERQTPRDLSQEMKRLNATGFH